MNGHRACQHYHALKKHFSTDKYDVFKEPRVMIPEDSFFKQKERFLYDKLASNFESKELLEFMVANFVYGYEGFVYDPAPGIENYKTWLKNKQMISRLFEEEMLKVDQYCEDKGYTSGKLLSFDGPNPPPLLKMFLGKFVSIETMVIADSYLNYLTEWKGSMSFLFTDEIRRIDKSRRFIKFDKERTDKVIESWGPN